MLSACLESKSTEAFVIPAREVNCAAKKAALGQAGIQTLRAFSISPYLPLDSRLRGNDSVNDSRDACASACEPLKAQHFFAT